MKPTKNSLAFSHQKKLCIIPINSLGSRQLIIEDVIKIPPEKPEVEQINDVLVDIKVEDLNLVYVKDKRCNQLTIKAIVKGNINEKIVYTADLEEQSIHSAYFNHHFQSFVIFDFDLKVKDLCLDNLDFDFYSKYLDTYICIEDITIRKVKQKKFIKYITLLITVNGDINKIVEPLKK